MANLSAQNTANLENEEKSKSSLEGKGFAAAGGVQSVLGKLAAEFAEKNPRSGKVNSKEASKSRSEKISEYIEKTKHINDWNYLEGQLEQSGLIEPWNKRDIQNQVYEARLGELPAEINEYCYELGKAIASGSSAEEFTNKLNHLGYKLTDMDNAKFSLPQDSVEHTRTFHFRGFGQNLMTGTQHDSNGNTASLDSTQKRQVEKVLELLTDRLKNN